MFFNTYLSTAPFSGENTDDDDYREQLITEIRQDLDELEQLSPEMFAEKANQYRAFYPRSYRVAAATRDSHHRVRRQIVDECCRQSCTLSTLKQYCAD